MAKILINGGTGFVGYQMLLTQPEGMNCFYVGRSGFTYRGAASEAQLSLSRLDYVIHLAPTSPTESIELAKHNHCRLLYASSGIVYYLANDTEYRRNKIRWEQECLRSGADVVIARLFTFFGERLDDGKAITQFLKAAREGRPLRIWGDGSCIRSYMSGERLGRWLWAILLRGERGEAYDVGADKPIAMLELAQFVASHYDPPPSIVIENGKDPMPVYLPPNTAKTKALLQKG